MLYFAYGSNMNLEQMQKRCNDDFTTLGWATLPDYEFGFDTRGYANIRKKKDEKTLGVLFEIGDCCLLSLNRCEGYPDIYNRKELTIRKQNNDIIKAEVYIERQYKFGGKPSKQYLDKIIDGAKKNNLPEFWIKKIIGE